MSTKSSFISLLENISALNKNSIEIMTKMNQAVSTPQSSVTVNLIDIDGTKSSFQMPTLGYLKNEIDIANTNIKKLANLNSDSGAIIIDGKSSKKVYSVDLNREPAPISSVNPVTSFKTNVNWFFESLMNPLISITLDLSGRIDDKTTKIISRRYIIKFEKDTNGNLTTRGQSALDEFKSLFLNNANININSFLSWYTNPTNLGVQNNNIPGKTLDEQMFDLNYKTVNYRGIFSVIRQETDTLNNKAWYHLDKLNYTGIDGTTRALTIGDELILNNKNSMTRYKIREVNTSASLNRISVETIEGYDPIPIGYSVLKYYSTLSNQKTVNVTIGFDEYNILFVKPINTENNIIGAEWSAGFAYYTNDLTLDTDRNINLSKYYIDSVYDYGVVLKDLVIKTIPSEFGTPPAKPTLITDNFKVVQINKHLTDTLDTTQLKKLTSQKNTSKSKISQINDAIIEKNKELNTKVFKSIAEKTKSQNELDKLVKTHESETKLYSSVVVQLKNSIPTINADPKYKVRGFWDFPSAVVREGYKDQETIGFEVQYKYKAKSGQENATEGFKLQQATTTTNTVVLTKMGYYSNWITYKTDIRTRYYDSINEKWRWKIEDVSDADTPNVNQLDISINPNESVDIKIRAISEVGYPNAPIYSDWSEILTVVFPDDLYDVASSSDFMLKEATSEDMKVQFESELTAKGLTRHVQDAFYVNEAYYAHNDKVISTSFKDSFGNSLSLFDYLRQINDKITALEEIIKRSKGQLKVTLFKGTEEIEITNNSLYNVIVNCDDYNVIATGTTSWFNRAYQNYIYLIQDFYVLFENNARDNDLGLLSDKQYGVDINIPDPNIPNLGVATVIDESESLKPQLNYQYCWLIDRENNVTLYKDVSTTLSDNVLVLGSDDINIGSTALVTNYSVRDDNYWTYSGLPVNNSFLATIHPVVKNIIINNQQANELVNLNDDYVKLIRPQSQVKIPLNIYYKIDGRSSQSSTVSIDPTNNMRRTKKLKFYLEPENSSRGFTFTLKFTLIRNDITPQVTTTQGSNNISNNYIS